MLSPPAWTRSSPRSKRNGYTGTGYIPAPVFSCPHAEHQFDIREPAVVCVHLAHLIRWRHSAPILHVILFHGGEGRELTENPTQDKTIRERPNRADKNGAIIVPPPVSPFAPPPIPLTPHHAPHDTTSPNRQPTHRHATHTDTHAATPHHTATPPCRYDATTPHPNGYEHAAIRHARRNEHEKSNRSDRVKTRRHGKPS